MFCKMGAGDWREGFDWRDEGFCGGRIRRRGRRLYWGGFVLQKKEPARGWRAERGERVGLFVGGFLGASASAAFLAAARLGAIIFAFAGTALATLVTLAATRLHGTRGGGGLALGVNRVTK